MKFGLFGKKIGMVSIFDNKGILIPVTLISISNNYITNKIIFKKKKYFNISFLYKKKKLEIKFLNKSLKNNLYLFKYSKYLKVNNYIFKRFLKNQFLPLNIFYLNQRVNLKSFSIGKGFSGVIKKHNFKSGNSTHGNSKSHRSHGSVGMCQDPGRVFLGKKMAGRLGGINATSINLKIINIDFDYNLIYLKGNVSGFNNCIVFIYYNF